MKKILLGIIALGMVANATINAQEEENLFAGSSWEILIKENGELFEAQGTKVFETYWDCWVGLQQLRQWTSKTYKYECYKSEELEYIEENE